MLKCANVAGVGLDIHKLSAASIKGLGIGSGVDPESTVTTKPQPKDVGAEAAGLNGIAQSAKTVNSHEQLPVNSPKSVVTNVANNGPAPAVTKTVVA